MIFMCAKLMQMSDMEKGRSRLLRHGTTTAAAGRTFYASAAHRCRDLLLLLSTMKRHLLLLLKFFAALMAVFVLSKPCFLLSLHWAVGADYFRVILHGLSLDASTAAYITAPLWLAALIDTWRPLPYRRQLFRLYCAVVGLLLSVILLGNICLYSFWGFPLDGTALGYLDSPRGITASVSGHYIFQNVAAALIIALGIYRLLWYTRPAAPDAAGGATPPARPAQRGAATGALIVAGALLFLAIRGGVGKSTANVGKAYFSTEQRLNHAALNPAFSIFSSLFKTKDFAAEHDYFPEERRRALFDAMGYGAPSEAPDSLLAVERPNVLIIIMEGCGGTFVHAVDSLASPDVTPHLNALAREGVLFTRCYANSFRTDRGVLSLLSGYPAFPNASVMKLPAKCAHLPGIAATLRRAGYSTDFLYGGDIDFTNTRGYLLSTGYDTTYGDTDFPAAVRHTHNWGVTDHIVLDRLLDLIARKPAGRPWHTACLTLASHEPWGVPYRRISGDTVANAMAYLDDCVGRFIERLKRTPAWKQTLVILVPDHGIGYPAGIGDEDPRRSHIPMIWTGGALRGARRIDRLCNQSDLAATLAGQLALPHDDFPLSRDILSRNYRRPSALHVWSGGMLYINPEGYTALQLLTTPQQVIGEAPQPSPERADTANAILQSAYDDLGRR